MASHDVERHEGPTLLAAVCRGFNRTYPGGFGRKRIARIGRSALRPSTRLPAVEVGDGFRMDLVLSQYIDSAIYFSSFEFTTCRALSEILRPGGAFVDVGANIGYFTLIAARRVGPSGCVWAFEPNPAVRRRLEAHVESNGFDQRVRVHACGLAQSARSARLYVPTGPLADPGLASTCQQVVPDDHRPVPIELCTLDDLWKEPRLDLIKLDVEGGELAALRGAEVVLSRFRPHVICEYNPDTSRSFGYEPMQIAELVRETVGPCRVHLLTSRRILRDVEQSRASLCRPKVENWWFEPLGRTTC